MSELSIVGQSVIRPDSFEKATGRARYSLDMKFPNMLHSRILRSPIAHARLLGIDTSAALHLPGVRAVLTSEDVPDERIGLVRDRPLLARGVVRFIGEPVAAVAADSVTTAEEAVRLIRADYAEMAAIFDAEEAMTSTPLAVVHPDLFNYVLQPIAAPPYLFEPGLPNVYLHRKIRSGDVERGFQDADLLLENRYTIPRIHHSAMEALNVIASPEPDGGVSLWATTTRLYGDQADLCRLLKLPPEKVRVKSSYLGGNFGSKNQSQVVMGLAACLALKTGRPVKLALDRQEQFLESGSREGTVVYVKDGVKKDGTLVAREMKLILNIGAYSSGNMIVATRNCLWPAVAIYRVPNCKMDAYGVATNEPPAGSYITFGATQVYWALEQQMDMLAERLDLDPVEMRRRNTLREGEANACGQPLHGIGVGQCLEKVAASIGLATASARERGPWKRGKGIAVGGKQTAALSTSVVAVKVFADGGLEVRHTALEQGMGCNTIFAQIAAEEFHTSLEKVRIVSNDTATTPYDAGTFGHRTTYQTGNALVRACRDARRQVFDLAGAKLGVPPEQLEIADGRVFVRENAARGVALAGLFNPLGFLPGGGELVGHGTYTSPGTAEDLDTGQGRMVSHYGYGACGVEVAVNVETGSIKVLHLSSCFDVGRPINGKLCEAQMDTGMGLGIGTALTEDMMIENGMVLNPGFTDYKPPTAVEMPANSGRTSTMAGDPLPEGPYGAKGFAEGTMVPVAPAIANAVYNAIGVRIMDLPITAERILQAQKR